MTQPSLGSLTDAYHRGEAESGHDYVYAYSHRILTIHDEECYRKAAADRGADGFILK